MTPIGKHFTLEELTRSEYAIRHGISNTADDAVIKNLTALVEHVLDPLREFLGKPIHVSSGFRSSVVNRSIGGASISQHILGQAADIEVEGLSVQELFDKVQESGLPFDQCILEFPPSGWVHISYNPNREQRHQKLLAQKSYGKTAYTPIA